jgi:hypothetical protein
LIGLFVTGAVSSRAGATNDETAMRHTSAHISAILVGSAAWSAVPEANGVQIRQLQPPDRWAEQLGEDRKACSWVLDYALACTEAASFSRDDVTVKVQSVVSNSSVPLHAIAREVTVALSAREGFRAEAAVADGCSERVTAYLWRDVEDDLGRAKGDQGAGVGRECLLDVGNSPFHLVGEPFRLRLVLTHIHQLYGAYQPLLGRRQVTLRLGAAEFRDEIMLLKDPMIHSPITLGDVPLDRQDSRAFTSPPASLYLAADLPGEGEFLFPGVAVRYGSRVRLTFWYLVSSNSQTELRMLIRQYQDSGLRRRFLVPRREYRPRPGNRWIRFVKVFRTDPRRPQRRWSSSSPAAMSGRHGSTASSCGTPMSRPGRRDQWQRLTGRFASTVEPPRHRASPGLLPARARSRRGGRPSGP